MVFRLLRLSSCSLLAVLSLIVSISAAENDPEQEFKRLDDTVWAKELDAQKHEETLVHFWDDFRAAVDKFEVIGALDFETLKTGVPGTETALPWGIKSIKTEGAGTQFTHDAFVQWLTGLKSHGIQIPECEFHQSEYEIDVNKHARSTFNVLLHVVRPRTLERYVVKGPVKVYWSAQQDKDGLFKIKDIDASALTILSRTGQPGFSRPLTFKAFDLGKHSLQLNRVSHPESIILYDLDRDGKDEVIAAGWNLVFWNRPDGFQRAELLPNPPKSIQASIIADFDNDGLPDMICASKDSFLTYHAGLPGGKFAEGRPIEATGKPLEEVLSISAGDVDGDGALDLWVTQYKGIYGQGQMPSPSYFDANDGRPSFLLHNDGTGKFTDITESAGLAAKRNRRTYSSSLVDLFGHNHMDLVVCSDYSGIDVYENDGEGHFKDVTDKVIDEPKCFGMSLAFADFNGDGHQDIFMSGMGSTTARRLQYMGLGRDEFPEHNAMRMRMGYGNRMYLASPAGKFIQPPFKDSLARTGWSWGCAAMDFDSDGFPDLYIGNGLQSGKSSRDYCTEFWRRDVYVNSPEPNLKLDQFYTQKLKSLHNGEISWNGYEHKNLLLNLDGKDFVNVAWLMDVAYEFDGRAVACGDLNLDGRPDIVLTQAGGIKDEALHIVANRLNTGNNWIGVQLREEGDGGTPVGAKITVMTPTRKHFVQITTGDSYMSQQSNTRHFGLGSETSVDYIEVRWTNGKVRRMENPAINQYIYVKPL